MSRGKTNPLKNQARQSAVRENKTSQKLSFEMVRDETIIRAKLLEGAEAWNQWKKDIPYGEVTFHWRFKVDGDIIQISDLPGNLTDYDFSHCELVKQKLANLELPQNLTRTKFEHCELDNIEFKNTELIGASFSQSILNNCLFTNASFDSSFFYASNVENSQFIDCNANKVHIKRVAFKNSIFKNCRGTKWEFHINTFDNSKLIQMDLPGLSSEKTSWENTTITDSNLSHSEWEENFWHKCKLNNVSLRAAKSSKETWDGVEFNLNDIKMWRWVQMEKITHCDFNLISLAASWEYLDFTMPKELSFSNRFSQKSNDLIPKVLTRRLK